MKNKRLVCVVSAVLFAFLLAAYPSTGETAEGIVIGHPACLSGKYAKAGEQALGGLRHLSSG